MLSSRGMLRVLARLWALLLVLLVVGSARGVHASDRIDTLAYRLAHADDFRVRTQAALALGASRSTRAVTPLCRGLDDSNTTVRAAAAAALGKLHLGGTSCLEARYKEESSASVRSVIKKALARIAGGAEPTITHSTHYYIAIGKTTDHTGRGGHEVDEMVRSAMTQETTSLDGYVVAPKKETKTQARHRLSKYPQLKAFYLSAKVLKPRYSGGNLTIKVEVAIFTYPGKALKGTIPVNLTQQDVPSRDTDSEDQLIKMAASRAMEKFANNVERIQ